MSKSLHKLKKLSVSKVSLVPKGSNPEAHITFYKAKDESEEEVRRATFSEIMQGQVLKGTLYKIYDACYTMQDAIYSAFSSDDASSEVRASIEQYKAYVTDLLDELEAGKVKKEAIDLEDIGSKLVAKVNAFIERNFDKEPEMAKKKTDITKMTPEELQAHAQEIQRQLDEANTKIAAQAKAKADPDEDEDEEATADPTDAVIKGLAPEVQAIVKTFQSSTQAALKAAETATAAVTKMQEDRERDAMVEVARREIPNLPGTDAERGAMLYDLKKALPAAAYEKQLTMMKAASAANRSYAFMEIGKGDNGGDAVQSPETQLRAIAKQLQATDPKLSDAQAFDRACVQNTGLYAQMRDERFSNQRNRAS